MIMSIVMIIFAGAFGALAGYFYCAVSKRKFQLKSVTRMLFVTTQVSAIGWVSLSYLMALYSTIRLAQPFPAVELSQQVLTAILGTSTLKVVENIFEHNSGKFFGNSNPI